MEAGDTRKGVPGWALNKWNYKLRLQATKDEGFVELARLNQQQFDRFRDFIYKRCGIRIDEKKVSLLSNRIRRRLKAGDFEDFDVYYRFLTSPAGASELEGFLDAITTHETFFFRTAKHFDWLKTDLLQEVISQQRAGNRSRSLRIWSAGCASGAEPYSIAMCLAENRYRLRDWTIKILGTDISEEVLRTAREGRFKSRAVEAVTDRQRRRFFQHQTEDDLWQVRPETKTLVEFKRHNLMQPLPEPAFDCIFIRNVLIYFDGDSKQVVIKNLLHALAVGGYLVVGPSEGVYDMLHPLQKISPLLYQKVGEIPPGGSAGAGGGVPR
jgi:chemotaxis protein methyltransferase CheR